MSAVDTSGASVISDTCEAGTGGARGSLLLVGASYHTAPTAIRERLTLALTEGPAAAELRRQVGPTVVLCTCNRTEIYSWTSHGARSAAALAARLLAAHAGIKPAALRPHLYVEHGAGAAHHLLRVVAGLDSLVLGEAQVLGQARKAWLQAQAAGPLGPALDALFRRAVTAGRRIRAATGLSSHPSVASVAVRIAVRELGGLNGKQVAVVGAGATGKTAARALLDTGAHVLLVNRSEARATQAAESLTAGRSGRSIEVLPLDQLEAALARADLVITATAAPEPVITRRTVAHALATRSGPPLLLLDVAVPRDVEPAVRAMPGVRLLDMDDLAALCPADVQQQREILARTEALAAAEADDFMAWCETLEAAPTIVALRRRAAAIRDAELQRALRRLGGLSDEEWRTVEAMATALVNKLLHTPTVALRQAGARRQTRRYSAAVVELFALAPAAG